MLVNLIGLLVLLLLAIVLLWLAIRAGRSKKPLLKWIGLPLCGLLALAIFIVTGVTAKGLSAFYSPQRIPLPQVVIEPSGEQVARGEHITSLVCSHCHSPDDKPPLSGGPDLNARSPIPVGSLVPFNLTPAGPLKDWRDEEIFRAIRSGVDRSGYPLLAMSALSVRYISDDDIRAVIAYLRSQPAIENAAPGGDHPNLLFALFAGANLIPKPDPVNGAAVGPAKGPTAAYGEYLVRYLGCRDCHGQDLKGGRAGGLNPMGPSLVGAAMWSQDQFIRALRTGVTPGGHTLDPEKMFWKDFGRMDDTELAAVHAYLRSLAPAQNG